MRHGIRSLNRGYAVGRSAAISALNTGYVLNGSWHCEEATPQRKFYSDTYVYDDYKSCACQQPVRQERLQLLRIYIDARVTFSEYISALSTAHARSVPWKDQTGYGRFLRIHKRRRTCGVIPPRLGPDDELNYRGYTSDYVFPIANGIDMQLAVSKEREG
jgi:hypothetical protein